MKCVYIRLLGGLGNQMHCYAFGRAISYYNKKKLIIDNQSGFWDDPYKRQYLLNFFPNLSVDKYCATETFYGKFLFKVRIRILKSVSKILPLPFKFVIIEEAPWHFCENILRTRFKVSPYFIGYWASYLYYKDIAAELRLELSPAKPDRPIVLSMLTQINIVKSCSIHWRSYQEEVGGSHPSMVAFYEKATKCIIERYPDIVFFVFSDVPALARIELSTLSANFIFVDLQESCDNVQSLNDFYLMYSCEHAVIGDSTFSWWAAWLSDNGDKTIIAPRGLSPWGDQWVPPHWISIDI